MLETVPDTRVLFGLKDDWNRTISDSLAKTRFLPSFSSLDSADLSLYDAVIPLQLHHYTEIRRNRSAHYNYLIPSEDHVELCHSKADFNAYLIAEGFGSFVPEPRGAGGPYPYIWKPTKGEWGVGCTIIETAADESRIDGGSEGLAQEYIEGRIEAAVHVLSKNGRVLFISTAVYEMNSDRSIKGQSDCVVRMRFHEGSARLASLLSNILEKMRYTGISCFNIKLKGATPMILEMNPRFGGSLAGHVGKFLPIYLDAVC